MRIWKLWVICNVPVGAVELSTEYDAILTLPGRTEADARRFGMISTVVVPNPDRTDVLAPGIEVPVWTIVALRDFARLACACGCDRPVHLRSRERDPRGVYITRYWAWYCVSPGASPVPAGFSAILPWEDPAKPPPERSDAAETSGKSSDRGPGSAPL